MSKGKKFSLLANYQDDSLTRNRFLYDLADAVGTPYASDSRYVDFYSDGYYWGSYQMTERLRWVRVPLSTILTILHTLTLTAM